jgi:hypothetical protein
MDVGTRRALVLGIGIAFVIALGILAFRGLAPGDAPGLPAGLTEVNDPAQLEKLIAMGPPSILTSTSFIGHKVYTVKATLKNTSSMPIRLVDVKMTFLDDNKKQIHEEIRSAYEPRMRPLEPGSEFSFEIRFENPPQTWNYHVPETQVVRVAY